MPNEHYQLEKSQKPRKANELRAFNAPRPIQVQADKSGRPTLVDGQTVTDVIERWRIDEGWWREEAVSRQYWQLSLESGRTLTVFHDLIDDCWHQQHY